MRKKDQKIFGWGINDSDTQVYIKERVNGVWRNKWVCPAYVDWMSLIRRCYSKTALSGRTVCEEWKYFTNFKKWRDEQEFILGDLSTLQLDKDLLVKGNLHYSPETCCYIPNIINSTLSFTSQPVGKHLLGVTFVNGKFCAQCQGYRKTKRGFVGYFKTELEAHFAYLQAKLIVLKDHRNLITCQKALIAFDRLIAEVQYHHDNNIVFMPA